VHQHSHEQAAFRVVEDPRHDNGERDRGMTNITMLKIVVMMK